MTKLQAKKVDFQKLENLLNIDLINIWKEQFAYLGTLDFFMLKILNSGCPSATSSQVGEPGGCLSCINEIDSEDFRDVFLR